MAEHLKTASFRVGLTVLPVPLNSLQRKRTKYNTAYRWRVSSHGGRAIVNVVLRFEMKVLICHILGIKNIDRFEYYYGVI